MSLTLDAPMIVTSRLLPGVRVADVTISMQAKDVRRDETGERLFWRYVLDGPVGPLYEAEDVSCPWSGVEPDAAMYREMLRTVLSFLSAEADAYRSTMGGRPPVDGWLFNADIAEWAYLNDDEIANVQFALEG